MHQLKSVFLITITGIFFLIAASVVHAAEVRLSAAASMTDVIKALIGSFHSQHPGVAIFPNFGPSGGLAKQIQQGAPADIYISANRKWMTYLVDQKLIEPGTDAVFAYNSLVFVGKKEKEVTGMGDLAKLARIGIGTPRSVPAGQYAEQALRASGLYDQLLEKGKLVMAKDVRQALIYADRGETDGSFVYKTDALLATSAGILFEVPQDLYSTVAYPIGLTIAGAAKSEAKAFYDYLTSSEAKSIIAKYGFSVPEK